MVVASLAAILAGCAGGYSSAIDPYAGHHVHVPPAFPGAMLRTVEPGPPGQRKSWASPDTGGAYVYVCGPYQNMCEWFAHGTNHVLGVITGFAYAEGVAVDRFGNVYVADTGLEEIFVFARGAVVPKLILDDGGWEPVDVAVSRDGTVYVANLDTEFGRTPGNVAVYSPGATESFRSIKDPNFVRVYSVAIDEHHHLVACYAATSGSRCDLFPNGRGKGINIVAEPGWITGAAFDRAESLVFNHVDEPNVAGPNTQTWETDDGGLTYQHCNTISQTGVPLYMNFDPAGSSLFIANQAGYVTEQSFKDCTGSGKLLFTYSAGLGLDNPPFGVAESPGEAP